MEIIEVKLNGRPYPTHIDEHGVQRFVANEAISLIVGSIVNLYSRVGYREFESYRLFSLNEIAVQYHRGLIPLEDMIGLYTQMGYSVDGFLDLSYFQGLEIENPRWS